MNLTIQRALASHKRCTNCGKRAPMLELATNDWLCVDCRPKDSAKASPSDSKGSSPAAGRAIPKHKADRSSPMALRGKKPEALPKRLKALFFGEAGSGKTTAAIQFPRPYLIDTEKGATNEQYTKIVSDREGVVFQTNDFAEIVAEVTSLLSTPHEFRTLIIDPITTVYDDLIEKSERKVGTEFGRHYGEAKKQWKRLGNLLMRLDMNVIVTSHQKRLYGDKMEVMGNTFDGPKGLDYMFDLVFEVSKRGKERAGVVRKTRCAGFPEGDVFPFTFDEVSKRYGLEVLERQAVAVTLATPEQVAELKLLLADRVNGQDLAEKWLSKAEAETLDELPADVADKCIAFLRGKQEVTK